MFTWIVEQHSCAGKNVPPSYEVESLDQLKQLLTALAEERRLGELTFSARPDPLTGIIDTIHASFIGRDGKKKRFMRLSRKRGSVKGIKWKVGDKPTGRFRTFQDRSWPMASRGDNVLAAIYPVEKESYSARVAETTEVVIHVADHRQQPWVWRRLVCRHRGVTSAKAAVQSFFELSPDWWNAAGEAK